MKGRSVLISKRKRVRPRHTGPAVLKPRGPEAASLPPTSATAVVGSRELQLARALSDTEAEARDAALDALRAWLGEHAENVATEDWDKLCKALFYCVWMADTRPVITLVVQRVVDLGEPGGWAYLGALLRAIVREWHGVDRHRVDKYYELVSETVRAAVARAVGECGDDLNNVGGAVENMVGMLQSSVFARAGSGGAGVALHIFDYWLDSVVTPILVHAQKAGSVNVPVAAFERVMGPVFDMLGPKRGSLLGVSRRAVERSVLPLPALLAREDLGLGEKAQRDMLRRVMRHVWTAAASWDTLEDCRKGLYAAHAALKERASELEGVEGVLPPKAEKKKKKSKKFVHEQSKGELPVTPAPQVNA